MSRWGRTILWLTAGGGERSAHAGIAISTVFHVCVIAALGYWLMGGRSSGPTIVLNTNWMAEPTSPLAFDQPPASLEELQTESGGSSFGRISFVPSLTTTSPDLLTDLSPVPVDSAAMSLADIDLTAPVQPLSGFGDDAALGSGAGAGNDVGDGTGTDFFGLNAPGQKFVFVVDASGSMNRPFPGMGRTLLGRVKLELLRCISQMTPEQEFFIVFFNDEAIPMPASRLMEATPDAQRNYLRWMAQVKAIGETEPESALMLALRLNPDVVYFLTDGAFKYRVIGRVKDMNRRGTTIHTVGFGDKTGFGENGAERFMQMIADQNGGTYQFVSSAEAAEQMERAAEEAESQTTTRAVPVPVTAAQGR